MNHIAIIVDLRSRSLKTFTSNEVTFGRNVNSNIDIPDRSISRNQCKLINNDGSWIIKDLSSQKTTMLNGKKIPDGEAPTLKSGDRISFCFAMLEFLFYSNINDVPPEYRKRKIDGESGARCVPPSKMSRTSMFDEAIASMPSSTEEGLSNDVTSQENLITTQESKATEIELEKLRQLYQQMREERDKLEAECSSIKKQLDENSKTVNILEKEKEILWNKLNAEEEVKETMVLEIQTLIENLKECEMEKARLAEDRLQKPPDPPDEEKKEEQTSKPDECEDNPYLSSSFVNKIVDLVEVKWKEDEVEQLKSELAKKDGKITDLTMDFEAKRQELLDIIDKELLCSICSEVLYDTTTLNCMHTFCKSCLLEWKTKKKECPVCRTKIRTEVHSLLLDSFVDRLITFVGGDLQSRREEIKKERIIHKEKRASSAPYARPRPQNNRNHQPRGGPRFVMPLPNHDPSPFLMNPVMIDLMDGFGFPVLQRVPPFEGVIDLTHESPRRSTRRRRRDN